MRRGPLLAGVAVLLAAWAGPLPGLAASSFAAHMALHLAVVAVAAPLIALGLPGAGPWLGTRMPRGLSALALAPVAAAIEMLVVWGWHAPALCRAARSETSWHLAEQASWLAVGLLLWMSALASPRQGDGAGWGPWGGVVALLLTSMHMTLLGALIGLAPGTLYDMVALAGLPPLGWTPLDDQRVGGILMLAVGGSAYLAGGLYLVARALGDAPTGAGPAPAPNWEQQAAGRR